MASGLAFFKSLTKRQFFRKAVFCHRNYADTPTTDVSNQVMAQGTENEERLRVRRARPADVPRVLRFVREHARAAWPDLVPSAATHVVLADYVARALAQGHSMLAEQNETRRGWSQIRGVALCSATCPWDAALLERWARCVRCAKSRDLMSFTAHCLRAPSLHDKYRVHKILQVILMVPPDIPKSTEIVHMLATSAIKRGRDVGIPLLRFDVTNDSVSKSLETLKLKKEWQLSYDILPETLIQRGVIHSPENSPIPSDSGLPHDQHSKNPKGSFIAVYTVLTDKTNE